MMKLLLFLVLIGSAMLTGTADDLLPDWNLKARREFSDRRFGIFLHWGLYSIYAQGEWYLENGKLDERAYSQAMYGFYPSRFDAAEWARTLKASGARYVTFTARHHEGFSLWPTKADDGYNISNTPFKRDVVGELADACRKEGLQFNLYYSLMDWHRPFLPEGFTMSLVREGRPKNEDYVRYKRFMISQLEELCDRYQPGMIWFDGEWSDVKGATFDWGMDELYDLLHDRKVLVGNNRRATVRDKEDIQLFERDLPGESTYSKGAEVARDRPLEQCDVIQENIWGFRISESHYRTPEEIVKMVVLAAAKDSNLLMNIGPQPDGQLPDRAVAILADVGRWMDVHAESVYGTHAGGLAEGKSVVSTRKGNCLYLHFLDPSVDSMSITERISSVHCLTPSARVSVTDTDPKASKVSVSRQDRYGYDVVVKITLK